MDFRDNKGIFQKGHIPWHKGKSKLEFPKLSNSGVKKGNIPWNKDKKGLMPTPWNKGTKGMMVAWNKGLKGCNTGVKGHPCFLKNHTEEAKKKMSLNRIGMKFTEEHKLNIKLSKRLDKIYLGRYEIGHEGLKGKDNPCWKNGISKQKGYSHTIRAKRRILGGILHIKDVQMTYEDNIKKFGTLTCYLCLKPIEFKKDHLEHKIPLCRGGTNEYKNLAIACAKCNIKKNRKTEEEFRKEFLTYGS